MGQRSFRKGGVTIANYRDRYRLIFSYQGKRRYFYTGLRCDGHLADYAAVTAEGMARAIERDMILGDVDLTFEKYRVGEFSRPKTQGHLVLKIMDEFIQYKSHRVSTMRSLEKYNQTSALLQEFFAEADVKDQNLDGITNEIAEKFNQFLGKRLAPVTRKERLFCLKATWDWAIKKELTSRNPWDDLAKTVKVPPVQPNPFTVAEVEAIIQAFRDDSRYSHLADFVELMAGLGCRTGEAIALKWKHLSDDGSTLWIGETVHAGVRKATKTNIARTVQLSSRLQTMLLTRRPESFDPEAPIFTGRRGALLRSKDFAHYAWRSILSKLGIPYQQPYNLRHSLISNALDQGHSPVAIARVTGHSVRTLLDSYVGYAYVPKVPDLTVKP